jgi:trk system potassium uptake protein TrkA
VVEVHPLAGVTDPAAESVQLAIHALVGKHVEDIALPESARIGCIVRGEEVIMAHHDTVVQADDHVVLFITDRRHVDQVDRLFLGETAGRR